MKFLIEGKVSFGYIVPAQDFGYRFLEVVEYHNWQSQDTNDNVSFCTDTKFARDQLQTNCVPVGSIQFCQSWYAQMGLKEVPPLNVPENLWPLVKREVFVSSHFKDNGAKYFGKDIKVIKAPWNGVYSEYAGEPMFFTEMITDVAAEWRLFVLQGDIVDARCYLGDRWQLPNRKYCEEAARKYGKQNPSFTLDVFVRKNGVTDILECHDFFACGLYHVAA